MKNKLDRPCDICDEGYNNCRKVCGLYEVYKRRKEYEKEEGRMSLIDKEKVVQELRKKKQKFGDEYGITGGLTVAQIIIYDQPTVEERKKGKWEHETVSGVEGIFKLSSCFCSVCGCHVEQEANFCPNCGADMRGERKEE